MIDDLALTNMGLGDKGAAFKLAEQGMAALPIEKDAASWSLSDRDPRPGSGADGGARPRHRRFTETSFDLVRADGFNRATHSCAAPAGSNVRSAPE